MSPFHHFHGKTLLLLSRPLCFSLSWPCFWTAAAVLSWLSGTAAKNHQPEWRRLRGWRDRDFVENYWKCPPLHLGSSLVVCALCLCQMTLVWTGFSLSACLLCSWWTQAARRPSECCSRSEWFINLQTNLQIRFPGRLCTSPQQPAHFQVQTPGERFNSPPIQSDLLLQIKRSIYFYLILFISFFKWT